jgi:hypothetical protein
MPRVSLAVLLTTTREGITGFSRAARRRDLPDLQPMLEAQSGTRADLAARYNHRTNYAHTINAIAGICFPKTQDIARAIDNFRLRFISFGIF